MRPQGTGQELERRRRHPSAKNWQETICCGKRIKRFSDLRVSLVAGLSRKRDVQLEATNRFGAPSQTFLGSTRKTPGDAGRRPLDRRLRHRSADPTTYRPDNPQTFRREVSSLPCVETLDQPGFKLSETRAAGFATQRGSDRPLETPEMARIKKSRKTSGPFSLTGQE